MDILHCGPHNREATGFSGKSINLISPLPNGAEKAFNRIRTANIPIHNRWESIKREEMLLIFTQAPYGFGIPLLVFGPECAQTEQRILFLLLLPDARQFSRDLLPLAVGNGVEHIAVFVHQTPLTWRRRKQRFDRCQKSIMPISDNQIDLGHSPVAHCKGLSKRKESQSGGCATEMERHNAEVLLEWPILLLSEDTVRTLYS